MNEETKDKTAEELEEAEKALEELAKDDIEEQEPKSKKERKKLRKLEEHLAETESKLRESDDQRLRLFAEFDNFRKRVTRERLELFAVASREVIEALLPVLDDLERAQETISEADDAEGAAKGFELITNKLTSALEQRGLKEMASVGEEFDPELHEAVSEIEVEDESQKGKVVNEVLKGYYLNERIIRHAKVVVGR